MASVKRYWADSDKLEYDSLGNVVMATDYFALEQRVKELKHIIMRLTRDHFCQCGHEYGCTTCDRMRNARASALALVNENAPTKLPGLSE